MSCTYRTLNDCEMQHNAEVGLFTRPSILDTLQNINGRVIILKAIEKPHFFEITLYLLIEFRTGTFPKKNCNYCYSVLLKTNM
jgi:hypothetical protein